MERVELHCHSKYSEMDGLSEKIQIFHWDNKIG